VTTNATHISIATHSVWGTFLCVSISGASSSSTPPSKELKLERTYPSIRLFYHSVYISLSIAIHTYTSICMYVYLSIYPCAWRRCRNSNRTQLKRPNPNHQANTESDPFSVFLCVFPTLGEEGAPLCATVAFASRGRFLYIYIICIDRNRIDIYIYT